MKIKQTIKSLLALSLAMLIGMFSLQSFAGEAEPLNSTDYEQIEIDDDAMIPEEDLLDEGIEMETGEDEEPKAGEPLSHADDADTESDSDEDSEQPKNSQLMIG